MKKHDYKQKHSFLIFSYVFYVVFIQTNPQLSNSVKFIKTINVSLTNLKALSTEVNEECRLKIKFIYLE